MAVENRLRGLVGADCKVAFFNSTSRYATLCFDGGGDR